MKAIIVDGFLTLITENEQEQKDADKWIEETYKHYDNMCDFLIYAESESSWEEHLSSL